jgi:hypothetical protein
MRSDGRRCIAMDGCPQFRYSGFQAASHNMFINEVIRQCQDLSTKDFKIVKTVLNTILFANDQTIFSESKDNLQRAANRFQNTENGFNIEISTMKTKAMAFQGKHHMQYTMQNSDRQQNGYQV